MSDSDWKTPEILEAEAQLDRSVQAVRELAEQVERERPPETKDDDDDDGDIVLRHSSW